MKLVSTLCVCVCVFINGEGCRFETVACVFMLRGGQRADRIECVCGQVHLSVVSPQAAPQGLFVTSPMV